MAKKTMMTMMTRFLRRMCGKAKEIRCAECGKNLTGLPHVAVYGRGDYCHGCRDRASLAAAMAKAKEIGGHLDAGRSVSITLSKDGRGGLTRRETVG